MKGKQLWEFYIELKIINRKQIEILKLNNSWIKIKDSIVRNHSRKDITEEGVSEFEDRTEENSHNGTEKDKRMENTKRKKT